MRSHQFSLTIPSTRFNKVASKIVRSGVTITHRGHFTDIAINFDSPEEDMTMEEALKIIQVARGVGRKGCLRTRRLSILDPNGKVLGVQQTLF